MLVAEGLSEAADVLRISTPKVEETGYDNWDGGTTIWTVYLFVEPATYARLSLRREALEQQITARFKTVVAPFSRDWFNISITPKVEPRPDWRREGGEISSITRKNIIDGLKIDQVVWTGAIEEVEFLQ